MPDDHERDAGEADRPLLVDLDLVPVRPAVGFGLAVRGRRDLRPVGQLRARERRLGEVDRRRGAPGAVARARSHVGRSTGRPVGRRGFTGGASSALRVSRLADRPLTAGLSRLLSSQGRRPAAGWSATWQPLTGSRRVRRGLAAARLGARQRRARALGTWRLLAAGGCSRTPASRSGVTLAPCRRELPVLGCAASRLAPSWSEPCLHPVDPPAVAPADGGDIGRPHRTPSRQCSRRPQVGSQQIFAGRALAFARRCAASWITESISQVLISRSPRTSRCCSAPARRRRPSPGCR